MRYFGKYHLKKTVPAITLRTKNHWISKEMFCGEYYELKENIMKGHIKSTPKYQDPLDNFMYTYTHQKHF